jgi:hypothetical protein
VWRLFLPDGTWQEIVPTAGSAATVVDAPIEIGQ